MCESNDCGRAVVPEIWGWTGTSWSLNNVSFWGAGSQSHNWCFAMSVGHMLNISFRRQLMLPWGCACFQSCFALLCSLHPPTYLFSAVSDSVLKPGSQGLFFHHFLELIVSMILSKHKVSKKNWTFYKLDEQGIALHVILDHHTTNVLL